MKEFDEVLAEVLALLASEKRLSYRALKRRFGIDDEFLEDLKDEIIEAKRLAVDERGKVLVFVEPEDSRAAQPAKAPAAARSTEIQPLEAERRQLTVMFCDLADSTTVSERLDPEELREVIRDYQKATVAAIAPYEGHVAQYLGDGVLVYFGYPLAHEDDPQRAVHAGLAVVQAVRQLNSPELGERSIELSVRVGIHTGPVVVGEVGAGTTREQLALGKTPNVAARLQGLAERDAVVVSQTTMRLAERQFDFASLGRHELKGLSRGTEVFSVVGARGPTGRTARITGTPPLVARKREKEVLLQLWREARAGDRRLVLISGEAGIGKSTLTSAVCAEVTGEGSELLLVRCSAYARQSAFFPLIDALQRLLRLQPEEPAEEKLDRLEAWLEQLGVAAPADAALLAAMLSLPTDRYPESLISPQKQRELTKQVLVRCLEAGAENVPLLLVWEDLHWADPSSLEVIQLLLARDEATRLMVILTARGAEFQAPWQPGQVVELELGRLSGADVTRIMDAVTDGKTLPDAVVQEIVEKADGIPLFIEQLTRAVIAAGLIEERDDRYELTGPLGELTIPSTLQDSLMSRLDRLANGKRVAQIGSVIGRSFQDDLLRAVWAEGDVSLQVALQQLLAAELLYRETAADKTVWVFKHALIQDAAYSSLLRSTRRTYHLMIAEALEEIQPEMVDNHPEQLARHFAQADDKQRAIELLQKAGQKALRGSANLEAIEHLSHGLELLRSLPDSPQRNEQILGFLILLAGPLLATKGYGAGEVGEVLNEALSLSQEAGDSPQLLSTLLGLWGFLAVRGDLQAAFDVATRLIALAERLETPGLVMEAYLRSGIGLAVMGHLKQAREHLEKVLTLYDPEEHRVHAFRYGQDPSVSCRCVLAMVSWLEGYPDRSLAHCWKAVNRAQELEHAFSQSWAYLYIAAMHGLRGEHEATLEQTRRLIRLCDERGFAYRLAQGRILEGWALSCSGDKHAAQRVREAIEAVEATGAGAYCTYYYALLAECHRREGRRSEALEAVERGLGLVEETNETFYEAELHRLHGELTLELDPAAVEAGHAALAKALEVARSQGARSLELRALVSAARAGLSDDDAPGEFSRSFTEGRETADHTEARRLLEGEPG